MTYSIQDVVSWYQKKIGTYDKQQWEKSVEQRILNGFTYVPMKTAKLKTEFIDVDLVRGSAFTKTKPKHGLLKVTKLATLRLLLLPFYYNWWICQTSTHIFFVLLLLYSLQLMNIAFFTYIWMINDPFNSLERISASEILAPVAMMLILCITHSQIVSTQVKSSKKSLAVRNCSLNANGNVNGSSTSASSSRRVKRTKRRNTLTRSRPSHNYNAANKLPCDVPVDTSCEINDSNTYSNKRNRIKSSGNDMAEKSSRKKRSSTTRNVVWDTTPVKIKSNIYQEHEDDCAACLEKHAYSTIGQLVPKTRQSPIDHHIEQIGGVDRMQVPEPETEATSPSLDDDGFESLDGSGSSDGIRDDLSGGIVGGGSVVVGGDISLSADPYEENVVVAKITKTPNSRNSLVINGLCPKSVNYSTTTSNKNKNKNNYKTNYHDEIVVADKKIPTIDDVNVITKPDDNDELSSNNNNHSGLNRRRRIIVIHDSDDHENNGNIVGIADKPQEKQQHYFKHECCCSRRRTPKESIASTTTTTTTTTITNTIVVGTAKKHLQSEGKFTETNDEHVDTDDSETDAVDDHCVGERLLHRRIGKQANMAVIVKNLTESSDNSSGDESEGEATTLSSPGSFGHLLTEGTTSAGEWIGVTTNSEECSYSSEMDASDNQYEQQYTLTSDNNDHPFDWESDMMPNVILSASNTASGKVSCTMWQNREVKKADLSVLDISSAIIARVEAMPENMDYLYIGLVMSAILSLLPSACRLTESLYDTTNGNFYTTLSSAAINRTSSNIICGQLLDGCPLFVDNLLRIFSVATSVLRTAFGATLIENILITIAMFERFCLAAIFFFLLTVAERTFKQRFLYSKFFCHLTSFRRARKSELPHFRLNKVRNIKTWLAVRSYLKKRGPQRSVDVIVSSAFLTTVVLLSFLSVELLKDSEYNVEALGWCIVIGIFMLRFMTLGTKINKKYRNLSTILTEQMNLYLHIEQKPNKKEEMMVANSVLKLAADLLKELESPFKISGLSANPYLYTVTKVVMLSALSGVLSEILGFKLKLHKIKIK